MARSAVGYPGVGDCADGAEDVEVTDASAVPAGQRYITADELRHAVETVTASLDRGFDQMSRDLKETRHTLKADLSVLTLTTGLHARDIEEMKKREHSREAESKDNRRWLVGSVIALAGLVAGFIGTVIEFVRSFWSHKP
jgi:hypothetical protein